MAAPSVDAFIEQDARGTITGWSAESEQLFGWTRAEAIGMRSHRLIPERNRARHDKAIESFLASPELPIRRQEVTALHKDGREFRAEFALSIESSGETRRIIAVVRALTTDPRIVEAFRETERFRAILDQIEDGCSVVDLRGNFLFVNDAFCRIFGFTRERIIGQNFRISQNPVRHASTVEVFNQVYRTGEPVRAYEYQVTPSNLFVEQSITLQRDADGRKIGFVSIYRDCTARKQAEEAMARAKEAAEASNRAKSEFLANMSHEIRTPMNGIIGMTALALDAAVNPTAREHLQTIRGQAESLLTVVNDILDFSKIEQHHVEFEAVAFSLFVAVQDAVAPLALRAQDKRLALEATIAPGTPEFIVGDPVRLKQIVSNVLGNAIKFTEKGTVRLNVAAEERQGNRATLRIQVTDTGIGIPGDKLDAIFEPFQQADGSMTRRFGGTGLGLAIASNLARLMGGRIRVDSQLGAGSLFEVTLPITITSAAAATTPAPTAVRTAPRTRILIAEDNIVNQRVAAGLLTRRGHEVMVVNNGREAVEALQRERFELVLMDVQMPDMDGFEATAAIRERERATGEHIRIIAMTAHAMKGDKERCLAAGMDGYLSKPIDQGALYAAVEE